MRHLAVLLSWYVEQTLCIIIFIGINKTGTIDKEQTSLPKFSVCV